MKIALAQMNIAWEDPALNQRAVSSMAGKASKYGCHLIVLPEMYSTGFSMSTSDFTKNDEGEFLSSITSANNINCIAGLRQREQSNKLGKNTAVVYSSSGQLLDTYVKMHPFRYADEHLHFSAGQSAHTFKFDATPSSVFICYDLRFPEVFRKVARKVKIIFVIANWPASRSMHWETLLRARAIENQCFIVGVNRVGTDGVGVSYAGGSQVISPMGEIILHAGGDEGLYIAEIDPLETDRLRAKMPFLDDMKHDF